MIKKISNLTKEIDSNIEILPKIYAAVKGIARRIAYYIFIKYSICFRDRSIFASVKELSLRTFVIFSLIIYGAFVWNVCLKAFINDSCPFNFEVIFVEHFV